MAKDIFDKAKDIAHIVSILAVPIVLALLGWWIQSAIKAQEVKRDYVQIAVTVLSATGVDPDLRRWASRLLAENSPTEMTFDESLALATGKARIPAPPSELMIPPTKTGAQILDEARKDIESWSNMLQGSPIN